MTGLEVFALILFLISMVGAFLNFFPHWAPENKISRYVWDALTYPPYSVGIFILGMILLFIWG